MGQSSVGGEVRCKSSAVKESTNKVVLFLSQGKCHVDPSRHDVASKSLWYCSIRLFQISSIALLQYWLTNMLMYSVAFYAQSDVLWQCGTP